MEEKYKHLLKHLVMNKTQYEILAKPSGITLEEHRSNVISEGAYISESYSISLSKYNKRVGKPLDTRLQIVCKHHDDGKKENRKWQKACQEDYQNYLNWKKSNNDSFTEYSNREKEKVGKNIRMAATRHEFYSLKQFNLDSTPSYIIAAIAAHHGKLSEKDSTRWINEKVEKYWNHLKQIDYLVKDKYSNQFEEALIKQYEHAGPRGLLQFADHRASAKEDGHFVPEIKSFKYKFPHPSKRGVQKIIEENWDNLLLLVRAPTGAGKTDASLLWASLQIENKRAERLVIVMPTRFTSNALEINVAETLSDTGLYHSSAWFNKFQNKIKSGEIKKEVAEKNHEFARLLYTPITVCTIDHLLMALTLIREDHHQIIFNLANSCLVIDEADFYDEFVQANILILLAALKEWDVPVLLMSASLPESILPTYKELGYSIEHILEDKSDNDRIRFRIESISEYEQISEIEYLLEKCIEQGTAIIYANTVDKAMLLYDYFNKRNTKAIVYHSHFTEPHKKEKEDELIDCLGKKAWEEGRANGIAILTQIGEMSINISADLMISEICPIDRLTQRAGRLCRFEINKKRHIGELHVIIPQKNGALYPAPYGNFDVKKKSWLPIKCLIDTIEHLKEKEYSANMLVSLLNTIYSKEQEYSPIAIRNAKHLKELFISNWLINPLFNLSKDDTDVNSWKSRNIPPQDSVYVFLPDNVYFNNYFDFQDWKLSNSIEIPLYLIEKYKEMHIIDFKSIYLKGKEEKIMVIREGFYDFEKGVFSPIEDSCL